MVACRTAFLERAVGIIPEKAVEERVRKLAETVVQASWLFGI
jgi:hypothetical protein